MPPAVKFIVTAMLLYSTAIWGERLVKKLYKWMVITFAVGLLCDLTGTTMMAMSASSHSVNIHTIAGYFALSSMFVHLIWAVLAVRNQKYEIRFTRYSVIAWGVWMIAFLTGAILR